MGFDQIAIRVVPDMAAKNDGCALRSYLRTATGVALASSLVIGGMMAAAYRAGAMPPNITVMLLVLAATAIFALTILRLAQESLRAVQRIALSQIVEQMLWPLLLLGIAAAFWLGANRLPVALLLMGQVFLYAMAAAVLLARIGRIIGESGSGAATSPRQHKQWLAQGVPLAFAAAMSVILNRGDIIALGSAAGTAELAPYTAASRYAALLVLGLAAASAVVASVLRDAWRENAHSELQYAVDRAAGLAVLIAAPLAILFVVLPEFFLGIYGPAFESGAAALRILAGAQLFNALMGPVALLVVVCDLERIFAAAMIIAVIAFIALLIMLIPMFGPEGAAVSVLIALSGLNGALSLIIWRRTGIRSWVTPRGVAAALGDLRAIVTSVGARR